VEPEPTPSGSEPDESYPYPVPADIAHEVMSGKTLIGHFRVGMSNKVEIKPGLRMLLTDEVKQQNPMLKVLGHIGDELLIFAVDEVTGRVRFKYAWDSLYGVCTTEQAVEMQEAYLATAGGRPALSDEP
jgi:hypothetical protein